MHIPAVARVMVAPAVPPEVHTEGVVVVKLTASPDEAVALTVTGESARVSLANAPKVMVWDAGVAAG